MTPTTPARRVKFKQRTPRSTRGNSRRTQQTLVAALLAVGLGVPAAVLVRAVGRGVLAAPDGTARSLANRAPGNEPLLTLPAAAPAVTVAAPTGETVARPTLAWSTPAPAAPGSRPWETPFANGRNVTVAPVVPAVRTAPIARDAGFAPAVLRAPVRGTAAAPTFTAPGLSALVASAPTLASAANTAAVESAPAERPAPTTGAFDGSGPHPRATGVAPNAVALPNFTWLGAAATASTPNPNWTTGGNWVGSKPPVASDNTNIFYAPTPTTATPTNVDDNYNINSLTFQGGTPSYNVTASTSTPNVPVSAALGIGAGGLTDNSANPQTLSVRLVVTANETFTVSDPAGRLNLPGAAPVPGAAAQSLVLQGTGRTVTLDGPGATNVTGGISEFSGKGGALVKNGAGTLLLAGNNDYTGGLTLNAGTLDVQNNNALGTGVFTVNGGSLAASIPNTDFTLPNAVTVNADFAHGTSGSALILTGPVALGNASRTITSTNNGAGVTFSGVISASGPNVGLSFVRNGTNVNDSFTFDGSAANTYPGATVVDGVNLNLSKTGGAVAIPGDLTLRNGGSAGANGGGQLAPTTNLTVNTGGLLVVTPLGAASSAETLASLNGDRTGRIDLRGFSTLVTLNVGQGNFAGVISDVNASDDALPFNRAVAAAATPFAISGGALNKVSAGSLTLSANNTYRGGTLVSAGTLFANTPAAPRGFTTSTGGGSVLVLDGARLGGSGNVGGGPNTTVTIGGTLLTSAGLPDANAVNPGPNVAVLGAGATLDSTGILTVNGNLTLTNTALLEVELGGTVAGTGYDQVRVGGAIALGGDLSLATVNGFALTRGQTFYILDGVSAASVVSGAFANVANGVYLDPAGNRFTVNYADSDPNDPSATAGNDVSVTFAPVNVPEPGSLALAALGVCAGLGAWVRRRRAA